MSLKTPLKPLWNTPGKLLRHTGNILETRKIIKKNPSKTPWPTGTGWPAKPWKRETGGLLSCCVILLFPPHVPSVAQLVLESHSWLSCRSEFSNYRLLWSPLFSESPYFFWVIFIFGVIFLFGLMLFLGLYSFIYRYQYWCRYHYRYQHRYRYQYEYQYQYRYRYRYRYQYRCPYW